MNCPDTTITLWSGADPWVFPLSGNLVEPEGWGYLGARKSGLYIRTFDEFDQTHSTHEFRVWPRGLTRADGIALSEFWAPEAHLINNRWYIYFAAIQGGHASRRMWVIESEHTNPLGPYQLKGKICTPDDNWAIDLTVFQANGKLYGVWSGWDGEGVLPEQNLYIAEMDTPWSMKGERVLLSRPEHHWERSIHPINEGPQVIIENGYITIVYSADASWTKHYKLGMLSIPFGSDVMEPSNWKKYEKPVFEQGSTKFRGPGHACFIKHPTRGWLNVFHYKRTAHWGWNNRMVAVQQFAFDESGKPLLGVPGGTY